MNDKPEPQHFAKKGKLPTVLSLLGFSGLNPFAKQAGVSHETAYRALGACVPKCKSKADSLAKIHQTLHGAFVKKRKQLSPAELAICLEWHREWLAFTKKQLSVYCPGNRKTVHIDPNYEREKKRTARKHKALREATQATLDALKWD